MATLKGEVATVVYHNPESQYLVARLKSPREPGQVTVVGNLGRIVPGETVELSGTWQEHPKFGRQFQAVSCVQTLPATLNGIRRYLASGMMRGVGPALAERLVQAFGAAVLDHLDNDPEKLLEIEGIGLKKLETIKASWQEQREIRSLILFLQSHDVPPTYAGRIFKRYGANSLEKLRENPYDLVYEIKGIGFKTADNMALKLGFPPDSPYRLEALILYTLFQFSEQGHLFCPREELLARAAKTLEDVDPAGLEQALRVLEERKRVRILDLPAQEISQAVFPSHFYSWESEIATRLVNLHEHPAPLAKDRIEKLLPGLERELNMQLSDEQRQAVSGALKHKVMVITGGPGTGKTTITRIIIQALKRFGLKIKLAAPTGRAAKRLAEATGFQACTVHRLLGFGQGGEFSHNEESKLKAGLLLVDEASMLDCHLFVNLLRALPLTCRLILVGDVNQLPSVGPGNILADLLNSRTLPSYWLYRIFRQAKQSMIVVNAHRINNGELPLPSPDEPPRADFFWTKLEDSQKVQDMILKTVSRRIPEVYGLDPVRDVQVLTPMHKGLVGTNELNRLLQDLLNPRGREFKFGMRVFRTGDRVLQTRNDYEKEVFNGDLGWVKKVDQEEGKVLVDFEGHGVQYEQSELDELSLAYAISVHKSQGSEYPAVVMPLLTQHYILLQRNLIYTGLTRARRLAVIFGSHKALSIGIKNVGGTRRYTNLKYRLREAFSSPV
ncbi:MAG: ATP-dependent RecD-like DNA helicase [Desulfohalobiaceae bacterium]|nr:ATP-dependent RecD-like DNA helicase [Desulfohalobiaceae bacterium]